MKVKEINYILLSKIMLPLGLVICFAAYQLYFKTGIESYRRYAGLSQENTASGLSISPAYSDSREAAVSSLYRRFLVDTLAWKNDLWNQCAKLSQQFNCSVSAFPEMRLMESEQQTVLRQEVVFNGDFHSLLSLQHALDTIRNIGLVGGLSYSRTPRVLQTTLKIQLLALPGRRNP